MYTIIVTDENELVTSIQERIMQRSKLVDNLHILSGKVYKDTDMSDFTVTLEYILPISKEYKSETLELTSPDYKGYLEYVLPFDTNLTREPGEIDIQLTFTKPEMDDTGKITQRVRKTSSTVITIVPIAAWSDIIPDSALSALDQRLIATDAMIQQLNQLQQSYMDNKADDLSYEANRLQLKANGKKIGHAVTITDAGSGGDEDYDIVEF